MKEVSDFLVCSLKDIRVTSSHPKYRVRTLNSKSNLILTNYLKKYPLQGKKFLDFYSWLEIAEKFFPGKVDHKNLLFKAYIKGIIFIIFPSFILIINYYKV